MLELTPNNVSIVHCISLILFSSAYSGADPTITSGESIQVKKNNHCRYRYQAKLKKCNIYDCGYKIFNALCYNHDSISILYRHKTNSTKCNMLNHAKRLTEYIYNGDSISIQYRRYCRYRHQDIE